MFICDDIISILLLQSPRYRLMTTGACRQKLELQVRLTVFEKDGGRALGVRDGDNLIDVTAAGVDAPSDISEVLQAGPELLDRLRALPSRASQSARLSYGAVKHKAPHHLLEGRLLIRRPWRAYHSASAIRHAGFRGRARGVPRQGRSQRGARECSWSRGWLLGLQ